MRAISGKTPENSELMQRIRAGLQHAAETRGLTLYKLAVTYNIKSSTITYIMNGSQCTITMAETIADRLGMSIFDFLKVRPDPVKLAPFDIAEKPKIGKIKAATRLRHSRAA